MKLIEFFLKPFPQKALKLFYLTFMIFVWNATNFAQSVTTPIQYCGEYVRPTSPLLNGTENIFYDRSGNVYTESELRTRHGQVLTCNGQNDNFEIELIGTFSQGEIDEICEAIYDLDQLIISPRKTIIQFDKVELDAGVAAYGSPFLPDAGCGFKNMGIWNQLNLINGPDDPELATGVVKINSLYTGNNNYRFFLGSQPPAGCTDKISLYSVVQHEMLHVLGFHSMFVEGGGSKYGYFTRWDRNLWMPALSTVDKSIIGAVAGNPNCCDDSELRNDVNFQDLFNNCDLNSTPPLLPPLVFKGTTTFINSEILSNSNIQNALSHLSGECNQNNLLMKQYADYCQRTPITDEELEILCLLGWDVDDDPSNCIDKNCEIVANDDGLILEIEFDEIGNFVIIHTSDLLANDYLTQNFGISAYDIQFYQCGNINPSQISIINSNQIRLDFPNSGINVICYSVNNPKLNCPNQFCDQAQILIVVNDSSQFPEDCKLAPQPPGNCGSNLFAYGNFENFCPLQGSSFGFLNNFYTAFHGQIGVSPGNPVEPDQAIVNTPDIVLGDNGNQMLQLVGSFAREMIYFPLSSGIQPGCDMTLEFKGAASNFLANDNPSIYIYASELNPLNYSEDQFLNSCVCPGCQTSTNPVRIDSGFQIADIFNGQPYTAICCTNSLYPFCTNNVPCADCSECEFGDVLLAFENIIQLQDYEINWTNCSQSPINFIIIGANRSTGRLFLDDISVIADCDNELVITALNPPTSMCPGDIINIQYEICLTGNNMTPVDVRLDASVAPSNFVVAYGEDFVNGTATIAGMQPGDCHTLTLQLELNNNPAYSGEEFELVLTPLAPYACLNNSSDLKIPISISSGTTVPADFSFSADGCDYQFTSAAQTGSHEWDFGDGTYNNDVNPLHAYNISGSVTVTHTVSSGCGIDVEQIQINIQQADASFTTTFQLSGCDFLFVPTVTDNATHEWDFGDGSQVSTDISPTHLYSSSSQHQFTVTHTITTDCGTDEQTDVITIPDFDSDFIVTQVDPCTFRFTATDNTATLHEWDFGDGSPIETGLIVEHSFSSEGSYEVIHTLSQDACFPASTSQTVNVNLGQDASFALVFVDDCTFQFVPNVTGSNIQHIWDFGDPASRQDNTSTDTSPTHHFTGNGTYTVTHTLVTDCGSVTTTEIALITKCIDCCPPGSVILNDPVTLWSTQFPSGSTIPVNICVNGRLVMDVSMVLTGRNFFFDQNGSLGIGASPGQSGSNAKVILSDCVLKGCSAMWAGIVVSSGSALLLQNGTIVQDAYQAVNVNSNGRLRAISGTKFLNNQRGILTNQSQGLVCENCTFDAPNLLIGGQGEYGVYVTRPLDRTKIINSEFSNMETGIFTSNSVVEVYGSTFNNLIAGIKCIGVAHKFTQTGIGKEASATFNNCTNGIFLSQMNIDRITDNHMTNVSQGIFATSCNSTPESFIENNHIESQATGLFMGFNPLLQVNIINNKFTVNSIGNGNEEGIYSASAMNVCNIVNNEFFLNTGAFGFNGISSQNTSILNNEFHLLNANNNIAGINLQGSFGHIVRDNSFEGASTGGNTTGNTAFRSNGSSQLNLLCNEADNTRVGFEYLGMHTGVQHEEHLVNTHEWGLHLDFNADIGVQTNNGNVFHGPCNWEAILDNPQLAQRDLFAIPLIQIDPCSEYEPDPVDPPTGWFVQQNLIEPGNCHCSNEPECEYLEWCTPLELSGTEQELRIAEGEEIPVENPEQSLWTQQYMLYRMISEKPASVTPAAALVAFYESKTSEDIGQLDAVRNGLETLYEQQEDALDDIAEIATEMKENADRLEEIDELLSLPDPPNYNDLLDEMEDLLEEQATLASQRQSIADQIQSNLQEGADDLLTLNDAITTSNVAAENEKLVNQVTLSKLASGEEEFNDNQLTTLEDIAVQCFINGGLAVFRARGLLRNYGILINPDDACPVNEERILPFNPQKGADTAPQVFELFPNPAKNQLIIAIKAKDWDTAELEISDQLGRLKNKQSLPVGEWRKEINITTFPAGIYYVKIRLDGQDSETLWFIKS